MEPDSPKTRVSLRDIAKTAGVSHATVSLAIKNNTRISEDVRRRVREIAEKMGYRPDPMLSALSHYRLSKTQPPITASIAWLNSWPVPEKLRSLREFNFYWEGAHAAAKKFGYNLEEFRVGENSSMRRLHQILSARGVRGILVPPHAETVAEGWDEFPWDAYFVARFGRSTKTPASHLATADQVANAMLAFGEIRKRGYHRIGLVVDETVQREAGHLFMAGFLNAQRGVPAEERVEIFDYSAWSAGEVKAALAGWVRGNRVDAIYTTIGKVMEYLPEMGIRIPQDVGVAVSSVMDAQADAGIDQNPAEIGRVTFLLLNSLINDGALGIPTIFRQILVEGTWVDGKSLPDRSR